MSDENKNKSNKTKLEKIEVDQETRTKIIASDPANDKKPKK
jgi:hypothetical protein